MASREIKFRTWDSKEKKMHEVTTIDFHAKLFWISPVLCSYSFGNTPLMQFTGLIDCKGKEIYEGDIIRIEFPEYTQKEPDTGWVEWDNTEATYRIQSHSWWCYLYQGELEIIGNIYETPELPGEQNGKA